MDNNALTDYMADATKRLIANVLKNSISDPATTAFVMRFSRDARKAMKLRKEHQKNGFHIPGFLICSITTRCNLRCKGCYAVENGICGTPLKEQMSREQWSSVFDQAEDAGISFIILAGGEPLMNIPVLMDAAEHRSTVFPVFTNGTLIEDNIGMFRENRNLIPIVSLDGPKEMTDERRGTGVFDKAVDSLRLLSRNRLFHGISITVTSENIDAVTSDTFMNMLSEMKVNIVFFIEFVPSAATMCLALGGELRDRLVSRVSELRKRCSDMIFMSFPGDEKAFGGCIGAGRGFFHINPYGDAEACPASPYHDVNLKESTLKEAISSELFVKIRDSELISLPHEGGCALAEHKAELKEIIDG